MRVGGPEVEVRRRRLAEFAQYCVEADRGSLRPWLRRPLTVLRVMVDSARLPVLDAAPSGTVEGEAVRRGLQRRRRSRTAIDSVVSVLLLPPTLDEYVQTPARRPVRRKVRVAHREGVHWAPVTDAAQRASLKTAADERERAHPDPLYRRDEPSNEDLLDHDLWLAAWSADGRPLVLVVIPVDGRWAVLRYFRTLVDGQDATVARYLLTEALVGQLIDRGVTRLADTESPFVLPNGLRHFQRMVGYELFRLRLR